MIEQINDGFRFCDLKNPRKIHPVSEFWQKKFIVLCFQATELCLCRYELFFICSANELLLPLLRVTFY